ncbi:MAG: hypothetical protein QUV07_04555 [Cyanobium sp. CZS 25K]|nr:hypothetical protein [Cyanobium sp. CZS25K]
MAQPANLKYHLYLGLREVADLTRNALPAWLVPPRRDLGQEISIAITTFSERYENLLKPLYFRLSSMFPDVQIIVGINGQADQGSQLEYLNRVQEELISKAPPNHIFILHDKPVGLARIWNELLSLSQSPATIILNDDLDVRPWFRRWAEKVDWTTDRLIRLNHTWSHFSITRSLIDRIGAFDSDFPGIGFEDLDYEARLHFSAEPIVNLRCAQIRNLDHHPKKTSFDHISDRIWGKYSSLNEQHFFSKWERSPDPGDAYIRMLRAHVRAIGNHHAHRLNDTAPRGRLGNTFYADRPA